MHGATWLTNNALSAASLIVSLVALILSLRAQHEANAAQKRIVEIEERRDKEREVGSRQARLQAELRGARGADRLYLINNGVAEARNVSVRLDGKPVEDHCAVVAGDSMPSLVGPGAEVSCLLAISMDCHPPFECEVRWDDDSGPDRLYRTTLTW